LANKTINDFSDNTTPGDNTELLIQENGTTGKSSLLNLLKRVFGFDDVYNDYMVSIHAIGAPSGNTAPTLELFRDNLYFYEFATGPQETEGFFMIHLEHDIKPGTDMTFHLHWSHNQATPTGNMKWNVDYTIARGYGAGTFGATTTLSTIQTAGAQYTHHITDDDDMVLPFSSGEIEPDSIVMGRVWRDSNDVQDTFNNGVFLLQVDLHYVKSRIGTRERNRPFPSGGF